MEQYNEKFEKINNTLNDLLELEKKLAFVYREVNYTDKIDESTELSLKNILCSVGSSIIKASMILYEISKRIKDENVDDSTIISYLNKIEKSNITDVIFETYNFLDSVITLLDLDEE